MSFIRPRLLALALFAVTWQLAGTGVPSAVLYGKAVAESAALRETTCTCAHGTNTECPMHKSHKKAESPTDASSRQPRLCNAFGDSSELVLTTFLFAGPVVDRVPTTTPADASERLITTSAHPVDFFLPIVSPPPRA